MQILYYTDLSREGNDCYIYNSIALIKEFDVYYILYTFRAVGGWSLNNQTVKVSDVFEDLNKAKKEYVRKGGKIE